VPIRIASAFLGEGARKPGRWLVIRRTEPGAVFLPNMVDCKWAREMAKEFERTQEARNNEEPITKAKVKKIRIDPVVVNSGSGEIRT
jgi:hypothetical protein